MRQLLIALVKDGTTDVIRSCNADAARMAGRPLAEIIDHRSSEIWPDDGTNYRVDDREVIRSQRPKLDISEWVVINGERVSVVTDKYPVGGSLVQVLVWFEKTQAGVPEAVVDYRKRYSVAVVERSPRWKPKSAEAIPDGFSPDNILLYDVVPRTGEVLMTKRVANKLRTRKNLAALENGERRWRVVIPPGYR